MNVGLVDADNWGRLDNCFPNLPLMKLSAYHKKNGDFVEWCQESKYYDVVYISKVFSFSDEPSIKINAEKIIRGGTGYSIQLQDGKEVFYYGIHSNLPDEIEHIFPDYSLYGINNTAYGFMSRGCPRGCDFCHVAPKEGKKSHKVADLSEFWNGQKYIQIMDPNTFASPDWKDICQQLIDSGAYIEFNQGVDIRIMTDEKIEMLQKMRIQNIHFAWDRYQDKKYIVPKLKRLKELTGWERGKVTVYILTNFDTTIDQDLERVIFCKSLNFTPYIMRYNKENIPRGSELNMLARYVNTKMIFWKCPTFWQYKLELQKGFWR